MDLDPKKTLVLRWERKDRGSHDISQEDWDAIFNHEPEDVLNDYTADYCADDCDCVPDSDGS